MPLTQPEFTVSFAQTEDEHLEALRLRYDVFVREFGTAGQGVDHQARIESDAFDAHALHLLLKDRGRVVGVYRLLDEARAKAAGGFYSEAEFDLGPLLSSGRKLLELGRSCLHPDYRGGQAMLLLWSAVSDHVIATKTEILFGTASFQGTDTKAIGPSLALLSENHRAPPDLRAVAVGPDALAYSDITMPVEDRRAAMLKVPSLIKAYLRLGGFVGDGAFVDHAFNSTDVLLILDVARMTESQRAVYSKRTPA
ncbi:GNAT family N-acyltransferase [Marivivens sp. LCG002]|uniref:GNAT family N-acetyltransferase n=1 Tax=Marivivens sp. LCG002 TaxID=3051171 RepID=UPI002553B756|nr:GNAT family N-acetyltransferase [Marivivens sp. LCG002]WIV52079.1 GNAT family N-acyltransferase [Marivivens sp. LCG002]